MQRFCEILVVQTMQELLKCPKFEIPVFKI